MKSLHVCVSPLRFNYAARVTVFVVVAATVTLCGAQRQQAQQTQPAQEAPPGRQSDVPTFRSDVRLVNVFATVLDQNGSPVADLQKNDFEVLEDNVPQAISVFDRESEVPLNIVIAVDTSLSTRKDLPVELASARRFAHDIVRPEDRLAVYRFDENVSEIVPFTSDLKAIDRGLDRMRAGAATSLFD